ncbi:MAG: hypothetical protein KTV77_05530 [Wolbachia endosymbiont of Fragariocoptes setiger]|nr:hypothetical protein [Wolbachia endosymbiont of Fragariocoptes setiger]
MNLKASENYPAIINVPIGQVYQEGPKNYETTFIVSNDSSGELKGGEKKQNTIIIDTDYKNETIVDLNHKSLRFGSNEIEIENTYNLVANTTGNIHAFTDCKTRHISVNSTADSYISPCNTGNCFSQDYVKSER